MNNEKMKSYLKYLSNNMKELIKQFSKAELQL